MIAEPSQDNAYQQNHAALLLRCYRHWLQRELIAPASPAEDAHALYHAPFVVLSHDIQTDPRFNYANLAAQRVFELPWAEIVGMPSRYSAEPIERNAREKLLARVSAAGYINDYSGVRIARSGQRFMVRQATVWNLFDEAGMNCGQAACFSDWAPLPPA